jgi:Bacterial virulence factor lipase N-terminal
MIRKPAFVVAIATVLCTNGFTVIDGSVDGRSPLHALFNLDSPDAGPFPSNRFTIADSSQNTGLRVSLPLPDCDERPSDCEDLHVLNTLDGFNLQPRLSIPFDGPIDVDTVTSQTVFLVSLGSTTHEGDEEPGIVTGINQVVWDVATSTLHVETEDLLAQHTRYALIVTNGIRDTSGKAAEPSEAFHRFRQAARGEYKDALLEGLHAARRLGIREDDIVTASVFTTQSATSVLEKIRDQIKAGTPEPADFLLGPGGTRTVFRFDEVAGVTFHRQVRVGQGILQPTVLNLGLLRIFPGAVGLLAFGRFTSPDYTVHPGEYIPDMGTRTGTPEVHGTREIFFNLVLPSGLKPSGGWPLAIFGHGGGQAKQGAMTNVAASMAQQGLATLVINSVGHGFGPSSTLEVFRTSGDSVIFSAGGRAIDQDGNGIFGNPEGLAAAPPLQIVGVRDGFRQTAVDLLQLVRTIEVGMDVDGDGVPDLDPSRIYYFGQSQGGNYGTLLLAVEPAIRAGVPNVPGSPVIDNDRLSAARRPSVGARLGVRLPSLLNAPGVTRFGGVQVLAPHFQENLPLRDRVELELELADGTTQVIRSPVINTASGAMDIQQFVDNTEWVFQSGSSVAYARHLRRDPLPGVAAKSVLIQFARGDQTNPNPVTTAILRAGHLADVATLYRHDLAATEDPLLRTTDPHGFLISLNAALHDISLAAQSQIALFFKSDGRLIIHPEPARFFEVPITLPLPEDLNFIQ